MLYLSVSKAGGFYGTVEASSKSGVPKPVEESNEAAFLG